MPSVLHSMATSPKYIFFTDFDGTVTQQDSNDYMTDVLGYGRERRLAGDSAIFDGRVSFRDAFREMLDSINHPFDECIKLLIDNITLDPYFKQFYDYARANNIPVVVLSGGMTPVIDALLTHLLGDHDIRIVSNHVGSRDGADIYTPGGWEIVYHDDSHFGHDKSLEIRQYSALPPDQRPTMFYAGDGVSDLSAAKETDLLFAKKGHALIKYCVREKVPFTVFEDWSSILSTVKAIVDGEKDVKDVAKEGIKNFEAGESGFGAPKQDHIL